MLKRRGKEKDAEKRRRSRRRRGRGGKGGYIPFDSNWRQNMKPPHFISSKQSSLVNLKDEESKMGKK